MLVPSPIVSSRIRTSRVSNAARLTRQRNVYFERPGPAPSPIPLGEKNGEQNGERTMRRTIGSKMEREQWGANKMEKEQWGEQWGA
jgi:hypothetical protein